jgi:PKD repeat protein
VAHSGGPSADFLWEDNILTVNFADQSWDSLGTITGWTWDFGDGNTSGDPSPSHTYGAPGSYDVTLTVTDDNGASDMAYQQVAVYEGNQAPVAAFSAEANRLVVTFTDQSSDLDGVIAAWSWDFGDGASSTEQNPTHTYTASGTYNVTLTVTDDDGDTGLASQALSVTDVNQPPTAAFSWEPNKLAVTFSDASSDGDGSVVTWSWDFGDGTISADQNPSHAYASAGAYNVTLTVTDNEGATGTTSQGVTVVDNQAPTAAFSYSANDLAVAFTDASSDPDDAVAAWSWDFGDGATSAEQNPAHTYGTAGTYDVTLTVTDMDGGTGATTQSITVVESSGPGEMDVDGLSGASSSNGRKKWKADVTIQVLDDQGNPVVDAQVTGDWSDGATGSSSCLTTADGTCTVTKSGINNNVSSVTFAVSDLTHATLTYNPSLYSGETSVTVSNPTQAQGFLGGSWLMMAMAVTMVGGWTGFRFRKRRLGMPGSWFMLALVSAFSGLLTMMIV